MRKLADHPYLCGAVIGVLFWLGLALIIVSVLKMPAAASTTIVLPTFADSEVPKEVAGQQGLVYILGHTPNPAASLQYFRNGILQKRGQDYSLSNATLTIVNPLSRPSPTDTLQAYYRY